MPLSTTNLLGRYHDVILQTAYLLCPFNSSRLGVVATAMPLTPYITRNNTYL